MKEKEFFGESVSDKIIEAQEALILRQKVMNHLRCHYTVEELAKFFDDIKEECIEIHEAEEMLKKINQNKV